MAERLNLQAQDVTFLQRGPTHESGQRAIPVVGGRQFLGAWGVVHLVPLLFGGASWCEERVMTDW